MDAARLATDLSNYYYVSLLNLYYKYYINGNGSFDSTVFNINYCPFYHKLIIKS